MDCGQFCVVSDGSVRGCAEGSACDVDKDCTGGASWCATIELDRDGSDKMFSVVAKSPAGTLGQGCASAKIDQDPLNVSIQIQRFDTHGSPIGCQFQVSTNAQRPQRTPSVAIARRQLIAVWANGARSIEGRRLRLRGHLPE